MSEGARTRGSLSNTEAAEAGGPAFGPGSGGGGGEVAAEMQTRDKISCPTIQRRRLNRGYEDE